jgi:hypothetical protein
MLNGTKLENSITNAQAAITITANVKIYFDVPVFLIIS